MLTGHCHDLDQAVRCRKIPLELLYIRRYTVLLRLGALIFLIQIRSLKVDTQNLRSFYGRRGGLLYPGGFGHVLKSLGQDLFGLGDRRRQYTCHTLADNVLQPVPQPLFLRIICIKTICPVCVYINKTRNDTPLTEILVCRMFSIRIDS